MKRIIRNILKIADRLISPLYLSFREEKCSLISFYFHGLFQKEKDISSDLVNTLSQRGLTVEHLRNLVEYFLTHGYTFVSHDDLLRGLDSDKRYIIITFDDGYFNNQYSLSILKEYKIPAVFFVVTNYIKHNKCFWWDVLYRERMKAGISIKNISREIDFLKSKRNDEIERYIIDAFGERALIPISDIDRPFSPKELKEFSCEKYVFIGNHTADHAILKNYSLSEVKSQILDAQNSIYEITGKKPTVISYPNGKYSADVIRISKEVGLKIGFTIEPKKNHLPLNLEGNDLMQLGRFSLHGDNSILSQCEMARSDVQLYKAIRDFKKYFKKGWCKK